MSEEVQLKLENWYKQVIQEERHILLAPPHNYIMPNGVQVINFHLSPEYMTEAGWSQWTDQQIAAWHEQYDPKIPASKTELSQFIYQQKKIIAYGGITITKNAQDYLFETDMDSITMCTAQSIKFMSGQVQSVVWKVYKNNMPTTITLTAEQFTTVFAFGDQVSTSAFTLQGTFNSRVAEFTDQQLLDTEFINSFKSEVLTQFNKINRHFSIDQMNK